MTRLCAAQHRRGRSKTLDPHGADEPLHVVSHPQSALYGRIIQTLFAPGGSGTAVLSDTVYTDDLSSYGGTTLGAHVEGYRYASASDPGIRAAEYFDGFGQRIRTVEDGPTGQWIGRATHRDPTGVIRETYAHACSDAHCSALTGFESAATVTTLDVRGRPLTVDTPDPGIAVLDYSAAAGLDVVLAESGAGHLARRHYDGERIVRVDECNNSSWPLPEATSIASYGCASPDSTEYAYEPDGLLSAIYDAQAVATGGYSDPRHRILSFYDTRGQVLSAQDPDAGTRTWTYDATGNVEAVTNARGQSTSYGYDALDRVASIARPGGEGTTTFGYDPSTRQRASVSQSSFSQSYAYDGFGRLAQETLGVSGETLILDFERDFLGRPTRIVYPDTGTAVVYAYSGGYLSRVCEPGDGVDCASAGTVDYVSNVVYDSLGRRISTVTSGATRTFGYDPTMHRLASDRVTSDSGTDVLELAFQYDELGRLEQLTDTTDLLAAGDPDASAVYGYDPRGRLESASLAGATRWFRYDALGNLTGKDLASSGSAPNQGYAHPTKRHAVTDVAGVGTLAYDADGNVTRRFGHYQTFDSANRLVCVGTSPGSCDELSALYDADDRRIRETTSGSTLLFAGELFQYDIASGEAQASVFAFGERIAFKGIEAAQLRSAGGPGLELWLPGGSGGALALAGLLGLGALGLMGARAEQRGRRRCRARAAKWIWTARASGSCDSGSPMQ